LIEAAAQISESGIPLEKLEDHVKALKAEKETLQREVDEKRAILDSVDEDVESRTKLLEEYAQMKVEMRRYGIGPEDPRKIQACFQRLKDANYNAEEVIAGYANMQALRKEMMDLDEERLAFEAKLATVKDILPLAEQITQLKVEVIY
jgi:multidrug resistance efflux pump